MNETQQKIVSTARSFIGLSEYPGNKFTGNNSPEAEALRAAGHRDGEAWCSYLGEAILVKALPERKGELERLFSANVVRTYYNFLQAGFPTSQIPEPGDIMVLRKMRNGEPVVIWTDTKGTKWYAGHLGIVTERISMVRWSAVEGNTNDGGSREGNTTLEKMRSRVFPSNGLALLGFVRIS